LHLWGDADYLFVVFVLVVCWYDANARFRISAGRVDGKCPRRAPPAFV